MKSKLLSILLITILIITACNGQNGNNPAEPHETETAVSTQGNYGNLEFDFYEAMQNIYLFGNKISLPTTLNDMGEDFSLLEENIVKPEENDFFGVPLLYQEEEIGIVILLDEVDKDNKFKQIVSLKLGNRSYHKDYREIIQLDFLGISFNSTREEVKTILGTPTSENKRYSENKQAITYKEASSDTESKYVSLLFEDEKIVEIIFRMA